MLSSAQTRRLLKSMVTDRVSLLVTLLPPKDLCSAGSGTSLFEISKPLTCQCLITQNPALQQVLCYSCLRRILTILSNRRQQIGSKLLL